MDEIVSLHGSVPHFHVHGLFHNSDHDDHEYCTSKCEGHEASEDRSELAIAEARGHGDLAPEDRQTASDQAQDARKQSNSDVHEGCLTGLRVIIGETEMSRALSDAKGSPTSR